MNLWSFWNQYWRAGFEILLLAVVIYYFLLLFRGTRGAAVFTGFVIVLLLAFGLTRIFELDVMNWILGRVFAFLAIAVLVIFQPELRRALAQLGSQSFFGSPRAAGELIDVVVAAAAGLSQKKLGGLIAIECEIGFRGVQETGVLLDAKVSVELLLAIFQKNSPLHDGGVVLRGDRVVAAGCVFPLTQRGGLSAELGMRHRAGIGLSEETDAIVIMVSEETGMVSVAHHGHFHRDFDPLRLRQYLAGTLAPPARSHWLVDNLRRLLATLLPVRGAAREEAAVAGKPEVRE